MLLAQHYPEQFDFEHASVTVRVNAWMGMRQRVDFDISDIFLGCE